MNQHELAQTGMNWNDLYSELSSPPGTSSSKTLAILYFSLVKTGSSAHMKEALEAAVQVGTGASDILLHTMWELPHCSPLCIVTCPGVQCHNSRDKVHVDALAPKPCSVLPSPHCAFAFSSLSGLPRQGGPG